MKNWSSAVGSGAIVSDYYNDEYKDIETTLGKAHWVNDKNFKDGGYVEVELTSKNSDGNYNTYFVRFYDFSVITLMPDNTGKNYISSTIENSENKPMYASSVKNNSSLQVSATQSLSSSKSATLSNSISGSESYSFSEGFEASQKIDFLVMEGEFKESFEATQAFEKGWETGESISDEISTESSVSVELPPYTNVMLSQGSSSAVMTTKYNCPVGLKYKVAMYFSYNGGTRKEFVRFGDTNGDARKDYYQRKIVEGGKFDDVIDWGGIHFYRDEVGKCVPMSPAGATLVNTKNVTMTTIEGLAPIYPLASVESTKHELTLNVGETAYTSEIELKGLNLYGAEYYGFNPAYGHWVVTDENGTELTDAPIKLTTNSVSKRTTIDTVSAGTCYLKYMIDENSYATAENIDTYTKNSDLSATAMVKVTVKEDENAPAKPTVKLTITPEELEGKLGSKPVDLDDCFDVDFKDSSGKEVGYVWEAQERAKKGISFDDDNNVFFTKTGTFHVRVIDPESGIYSDWVEITVTDMTQSEASFDLSKFSNTNFTKGRAYSAARQSFDDIFISDWFNMNASEQADDEEPVIVTEPDEVTEPTVEADENTAFVISGSYTGLVGAEPDAIEGEPAFEITLNQTELVSSHDRLQIDAFDKTDKEINAAYTWEAQETEGITLTEDGKVSFTLPGTYHVRVKSGEYTSNWFVINAVNDSEEYSLALFIDEEAPLVKVYCQPWGSELESPDPPVREGYLFDGWDTEVPATMSADITAYFAKWVPVEEAKNIAADEELLQWVKVDYEKKTGVAVYPEYTSQKAGEYVIAVKDKDGNVLDTYAFDPKTGIGFSNSGEINLPQTGVTSKSTAAAVGGALAMIAAGFWTAVRSLRKKKTSKT